MLLFYCAILVPLFLAIEYYLIYNFNEVFFVLRKSQDCQTLLNRTGNPFFVLSHQNDKKTTTILHKNKKVDDLLS